MCECRLHSINPLDLPHYIVHTFPAAGADVIPANDWGGVVLFEPNVASMLDCRPLVTHHISGRCEDYVQACVAMTPKLHHHHYGNSLKDCGPHFCSLAHCKGGILFPSHSWLEHLSLSILFMKVNDLYKSCVCVYLSVLYSRLNWALICLNCRLFDPLLSKGCWGFIINIWRM